MWNISEKEFNSRLKEIQEENKSKERKKILKTEKDKYKTKRKSLSTSKIVLFAVFLMCIEIIIFCEYAMIALSDASAMYVLIGVPATLVPTVIAYYQKSRAENTASGIVYEKTMYELSHADLNNEEDGFEFGGCENNEETNG